jgi:hypothetical protein
MNSKSACFLYLAKSKSAALTSSFFIDKIPFVFFEFLGTKNSRQFGPSQANRGQNLSVLGYFKVTVSYYTRF